MKAYAGEVIRSRGVENITADQLIQEITPYGKTHVPEEVKQELLQLIKAFFAESAGVTLPK